jgi:hypothetical protein
MKIARGAFQYQPKLSAAGSSPSDEPCHRAVPTSDSHKVSPFVDLDKGTMPPARFYLVRFHPARFHTPACFHHGRPLWSPGDEPFMLPMGALQTYPSTSPAVRLRSVSRCVKQGNNELLEPLTPLCGSTERRRDDDAGPCHTTVTRLPAHATVALNHHHQVAISRPSLPLAVKSPRWIYRAAY